MRGLLRAWEAFWFAEGPTTALGVFRILFGAVLLVEVDTNYAVQETALAGGIHLPYADFIRPLSPDLYRWLHLLQVPAALMLMAGVFPRTGCALLLATEGWVFLVDQLHFRNHAYLMLLIAFLLMISPCGRSLALGPRLLGVRPHPVAPLTAQRLIQFQVCVMYVYAALNKLTPSFLSGGVLAVALGGEAVLSGLSGALLDRFASPEQAQALAGFFASPERMVPAAWATFAAELLIPLGLWWRRTRPVAILVGLGFHAFIGVAMDIGTFGAIAVASYVLFLEPETLPRLAARLSRRSPAPAA